MPCLAGSDPTGLFILEAAGAPAGFFQCYRIADYPEWAATLHGTGQPDVDSAAGIDYLIGDAALTGRGLGTLAIGAFTQLAFARYRDIRLVAVAVSQENASSWRALEKAGYRRCWTGQLASDDPADEGPMYLYRRERPARQEPA